MDDEPINILLVDDQPGKLLGYQAILEQLGENLLMARSAREALEILLKSEVALILIDVCMPELDGFELAEVIRTHPRFEKTAIMFVSGVNLTDLDRLRGYSAGAVDYVSVPVVPEILRAKVRVFADLHRKSRQLEVLNRELEDRIAARTAALEASTARWQESEERLRLALAAARAGAWEWRIGTEEMSWSPELFGLLDLSAHEDPSVEDLVRAAHAEDRELVRGLFAELPSHLGRFDLEFRVANRRSAGEALLWLRTTGEVVHTAGRPSVARGIVQDVTSRKAAELELANEARRKDQFLATLAHELRNPLAPIATGVRLLSSGKAPEPLRAKTLGILDRQVSHLVRLVDDLMDVSRISRGAITLHREAVDLADLLRTTVDASGLAAAGLAVTVTAPERGPFVSGDRVRIAQVVSNLLDNAVKFTPRGGAIAVELTELVPEGAEADGEVTLVVRDTGVGIAPEQVDRVFELFTQVAAVPDGRGLGIGLHVVRQLVELHGGLVSARSEGRDAGTEITVRLPRIEPPAPADHPPAQIEVGDRPMRFLVVDDNVDAATLLAQQLTLSGHVAKAAFSGEEATTLGAEYAPDVVLLDLGMPVMDGFETARRIRLTPWGRSARLFALTGWGQPSDRQRTTEAGFDGHLVKPVDLEAVLAPLRRAE